MTSAEIDRLCLDWLSENHGERIAHEYTPHALLIPRWNPPELNQALYSFRQNLCIAFGPDESFGTTDYREARRKLGLSPDAFPVPEVFVRAFAGLDWHVG